MHNVYKIAGAYVHILSLEICVFLLTMERGGKLWTLVPGILTFELKGNIKIKLQILDQKNTLNSAMKSVFEKYFYFKR